MPYKIAPDANRHAARLQPAVHLPLDVRILRREHERAAVVGEGFLLGAEVVPAQKKKAWSTITDLFFFRPFFFRPSLFPLEHDHEQDSLAISQRRLVPFSVDW